MRCIHTVPTRSKWPLADHELEKCFQFSSLCTTQVPFGAPSVPFIRSPVLAWQLLDYVIICADGMMF